MKRQSGATNVELSNDEVASRSRLDSLRLQIDAERLAAKARQELNPEQRIEFDNFLRDLPRRDGAIRLTSLDKIGSGSTHDVFRNSNQPGYVLKINRHAVHVSQNRSRFAESEILRAIGTDYAERENDARQQLQEHFGAAHCLEEKLLLDQIDDDARTDEVLIVVQKTSDAYSYPFKTDLSIWPVEIDEGQREPTAYDAMNKALLADGNFNLGDFLKCQPSVAPIFELVTSDAGFRSQAQEFLIRCQNFYQATGRFLDLIGKDNCLFYRQPDGAWSFQLGTVLKTGMNRESLNESLQALAEIEKIEHKKWYAMYRPNLMFGLTIARLLNAAGLATGVGKVMDVKLSETQLRNLDVVGSSKTY